MSTQVSAKGSAPCVVLGVTGGIAAYKAVEVCRRLVEAGAHVIPVMTADARRFVGEVTFSALASEPVRRTLWDATDPIPHTKLGRVADLLLVAPATARLIGSYANGISDDLLSATLLATRAPVVVCPAMHTEMWEHAAVQDNLTILRRRGVRVVEPGLGRLAGGDLGLGRLAEPAEIVGAVAASLSLAGKPLPATESPELVRGGDMEGIRVLVTAGGTREPIDPVRFIGNRSSGKQGYAIAEEALARGARVTLVTAASGRSPGGMEVVRVETASEMEQAVLGRSGGEDVVIMAAAVADFRPKTVADVKIPKSDGPPELVLEPTPDILGELGARRRPGQVLVGFAAETQEVELRAASKLALKGIDLIVANDVTAHGAGFEHDTNAVVLLDAHGRREEVGLTDKRRVAAAVLDSVATLRGRRDI